MKKREVTLGILIVLTFLFPLGFLIYLFNNFAPKSEDTSLSQRKHHILVIGQTETNNFLNKVYEGASEVSDRYDALVTLHVPKSKADQASLQSLFDYAYFIKADGIIAYIDSETDSIKVPDFLEIPDIPVVTVGRFNPQIPQISFIGNNYSETGRLIARTAVETIKPDFRLFILNSMEKNNNSSNLMSTMNSTLKDFFLEPVIFDGDEAFNEDMLFDSILVKNYQPAMVICLTEEDSIRTARMASDPGFNSENQIISYGENETISTYFNKGVIETVISLDPEKTGSRAMKEIFDYKKLNFANNYVNAGLVVKKGGKR